MADPNVLNKVRNLKAKIAEQEAERNEWAEQIPGLDELIAVGGETAADAQDMKKTAEDTIAENDSKLAQLRAQLAELEATLPKKPEPEAPKFDPEKHPLLKKATEKVEPAKPVVFHSGDLCEAQWTDRQWYKVKVQTVLGSASDPKYHVRFLDYKDSTLTVGRDAIRPLLSERKRKSDAPPTPTTAPTVSSGHVISGPASINPQAKAKQNAGVDGDEHRTRRKIGSNKALDRKKSAWEEFKSKGPGKMVTKKQSMFKTGDGPNSRVGFTGSGAGMTQAPKRVRYNTREDEAREAEANGVDRPRGRKDDWSRSHY